MAKRKRKRQTRVRMVSRCTIHAQVLDASEFRPDSSRKKGLYAWCKRCEALIAYLVHTGWSYPDARKFANAGYKYTKGSIA